MEIVLIALALVLGLAAGYVAHRRLGSTRLADAGREAQRILEDAGRQAEAQMKEARVTAREELLQQRSEAERELGDRRAEVAKSEERLAGRDRQLENLNEELARREQSIADREVHARQMQEETKAARDEQLAELQRMAGMSSTQARDTLLANVEEQSRVAMSRVVREIEEETTPGGRPAGPEHPLGRHPAHRQQPHGGDHGIGRPAPVGRPRRAGSSAARAATSARSRT